jgi:putative FmdB family regulatory protein
MPTYEYKCEEHGHKYSEIRSITEDQRVGVCPEEKCGSPLIRIFSAPPITFNGAGFATSKTNV